MDDKIVLIKKPKLVFIYRLTTLIIVAFGLNVWLYCYGIKLESVYFTNQSNFAIMVLFLVLIIGDICNFKKKKNESYSVNPILEIALMVYITITFLGFWGLLAWRDFDMTGGAESTPLRIFLTSSGNYIVHGVVPVLAIVHWILFSPHSKQKYVYAFLFLIYPTLYLFFVLIRAKVGGPIYGDTYYPYPFIDLNALGAYNFLLVVLGLLVFCTLWGALFIYINNVICKKRVRSNWQTI